MNILFICSARTWGGNEKWTALALHQLKTDHQVHLCYRNPALTKLFGVTISRFRAPFLNIFDLLTYYKIIKYVIRHDIQILLPTKRKEYFIGGIVARLLKKKNILRLGIAREMNMPLWHWLIYNKLNDGIIVNSYRIKRNLERYHFINSGKVKVIYNCLEKSYTAVSRKTETDCINIVSIGMLTLRKGHHLLLQAVTELPEEIRDFVKITIIGAGKLEDMLRKMTVELGLADKVEFSGFINDPGEIIARSDLFVLLSTNEGISNAMLEAMAAGVPVLVSRDCGADEVIEDSQNGFLTDISDIKAIIEKLKNIIKDRSKLKIVGAAGKKTIDQYFTRQRMKQEIEEYLHSRLNS